MEIKLLKAIAVNREYYDKIKGLVAEGDFTQQARILFDAFQAFYDSDKDSRNVDLDLVLRKLERELDNPKHFEMFKSLVSSFPKDVSAPNIVKDFIETKKHNTGLKLSQSIQMGEEKETRKLIDDYLLYMDAENLDEDVTKEIFQDISVEMLNEKFSPESLIPLWPVALASRIGGGVRRGHHTIIFGRPEIGKCFGIGTKILMADGQSRAVELIKEGEKVLGPDSRPRRVSGVTSGKSKMYRIKYSWGDSYVVNEDHILSLKRSKKEATHSNGDILNVSVKEYLTWPEGRKQRYKGWKAQVDFKATKTKIPPYILGLWLGDGCSCRAGLTSMDPEIVKEWFDYAKTIGIGMRVRDLPNNKARMYFMTNGRTGKKNPFRQLLKEYNVFKNKHIPKEYLINDRQSRLELLAGLVDTDGYLGNGSSGEITFVRKDLSDDTLWLLRSLGFHATQHIKYVKGKAYYRINFFGDMSVIPCRLPRKQKKRATVRPKRQGLHFSFTVEYIGVGDYYGFAVDKDHLFLLDDFTVVHNTLNALNLARRPCKEGRTGIYFGNEDNMMDVIRRAKSAFSGMTWDECLANPKLADSNANDNGFGNLVFIGLYPGSVAEVREIVHERRPDFFIVDQITNFNAKADNYTLQLGSISRGMRNIAKRYNCAAFSFIQAGDSADGKLVLDMGDINWSNTDVQATADLMIGIGMDKEFESKNWRMFSLCKNKITGSHDYFATEIDTKLNRVRSV